MAKAQVESVVQTVQLAALYLNQPFELLVAMRAMTAYRVSQRGCTPAGRNPPADQRRRREA